MKKWYNVELSKPHAEKLRTFCGAMGLRFETSAAGNCIHFEIELVPNSTEFNAVNYFLVGLN